MGADDSAAELATLRQELRRLHERVAVTEDAVASIEDGITGTADVIETAIRERAATGEASEDSDDEKKKKKGPDPAAMTPNLADLVPWVHANVSSWCERATARHAAGTGRGIKWCARWYEHPEAVTRLWVVRAAQIEAAEAGPLAVAAYLRDFFDYHLGILTDANGPFHDCSLTQHLATNPEPRYLPTTDPPLH